MTLCICGCGQPAAIFHHVVYQQELRRVALHDTTLKATLCGDTRGMVPMAQSCHERHHSRSRPLRLAVLPDEAFVFAAEVLGRERAYNYLSRTCTGEDARLDALLGPLDTERRAA